MIAYYPYIVEIFPFSCTFLCLHCCNSQIIHIIIMHYSQIAGKISLSFAAGKRAPKAGTIDRLIKAKGSRTPIGFHGQLTANTSQNPLRIPTGIPCGILTCPGSKLLRGNCEAPLSKRFGRDFWCSGRSLANARQGQCDKKISKDLLRGCRGSTPLGLGHAI